jgi:ribosomal protein L29
MTDKTQMQKLKERINGMSISELDKVLRELRLELLLRKAKQDPKKQLAPIRKQIAIVLTQRNKLAVKGFDRMRRR